ncbi:MAG: hypothetical protein EOO46_00305, partial [Flavobacterium sp.]
MIEINLWIIGLHLEIDQNHLSILNDKVDNIIFATLNSFEEENKSYKQLFSYQTISCNKPKHTEIEFAERIYKENLLDKILENEIEKAIKILDVIME